MPNHPPIIRRRALVPLLALVAFHALALTAPQAATAAMIALGGATERPLPAPADVSYGGHESDTTAAVIVELSHHALTVDIDVDITTPGRVEGPADLSPGTVPAGTWVDSVLVHVDAVGTPGSPVIIEGSLQFDREILGVIIEDAQHGAALLELGDPGRIYAGSGRQVELTGDEWVQLDQARRAIAFRLESTTDIDQIRVVTVGTPVANHLATFSELHTEINQLATDPGYSEYRINHPDLNGRSDRIILITDALDLLPGSPYYTSILKGAEPATYVRWDAAESDWRITRQISFPDTQGHHVLVEEPGTHAFAHTTTLANTAGNRTMLDHPETNGNPDARLLISPVHAGAHAVSVHPDWAGVWYDGNLGRWTIYSENQQPMAAGQTFHVKLLADDGSSFVVTEAAGTGLYGGTGQTLLDHPALNDNPHATPQATHVFGQGEEARYLDCEPSFIYSSYLGRWQIIWPIDPSSGFVRLNVYVPPTATVAHRDHGEAGQVGANTNWVTHPRLDGVENAIVLHTASQENGAVANATATGLYWDGIGWSLYNEDLSPWPLDTTTHVLRVPAGRFGFVHTAATRMNIGGVSVLDHSRTREQPDAMVFASPHWNPTGGTGVYADRLFGVWYDESAEDWSVATQDPSAILPTDASWNVYVAPPQSGAFKHVADVTNTVGNVTTLDHPMLNEQPLRTLAVTYVIELADGTWNDNDEALAIDYDTGSGRWQILNQSGAPLPPGAAFNVLPVPEPGAAAGLVWGGLLLSRLARRKARRSSDLPHTERRLEPADQGGTARATV